MATSDTGELPTKDEPASLSEVMAWLRERHDELVCLGVKATYESYAHAYIESLREDVARYESARIVLALELKNAREARARAEAERDQYKATIEDMQQYVCALENDAIEREERS